MTSPSRSKPIRLTRRGKFAAVLAIFTVAFTIHTLTKDVCWTGLSYGSCEQQWFGTDTKGTP